MTRLARWLGKMVLLLALIYGFAVLGTGLWLRRTLTPTNFATTTGCWETYEAVRVTRSQRHRDGLVLYALDRSAATPRWRGPGSNLYMVMPSHVYLTWWPLAERQRLFVEVADLLRQRPCRPWASSSLNR